MGSCVSVHRNPDSAMKLRLSFGSKSDKFVIPSPIKEKPTNGDRPIAEVGLKSPLSTTRSITSFRDLGSKDEAFFDSQPWLDSDCEDDFLSVNGDFTPSRGSTPVHQSFSIGAPRVDKALFEDRIPGSKPEPSPTDKKKRLSELFLESMREEQDVDDQNMPGNQNMASGSKMEIKPTLVDPLPKSANSTPHLSGANGTPYLSGANSMCSSERTPNGESNPEKEKSIRSVQCCLPRFLSSRSFDERKKGMSPAQTVG